MYSINSLNVQGISDLSESTVELSACNQGHVMTFPISSQVQRDGNISVLRRLLHLQFRQEFLHLRLLSINTLVSGQKNPRPSIMPSTVCSLGDGDGDHAPDPSNHAELALGLPW